MDLDPLVFRDGKKFFRKLGRRYRQHDHGLFILAPSGAGKTHFCKAQTEPHWIDGDDLWVEACAQPPVESEWWTKGVEIINLIEQRCDVITVEAKRQGFWVMGASNYWLRPDAIVIPDWETHKRYIRNREQSEYDGGAKSDALAQVEKHIEIIKKWHTDHGVPLFNTVREAVENLTTP